MTDLSHTIGCFARYGIGNCTPGCNRFQACPVCRQARELPYQIPLNGDVCDTCARVRERFFTLSTRASSLFYDVRPRYSGCSSGMVGERVAVDMAKSERNDYVHILEGFEGDSHRLRAISLGLSNIVFATFYKGSGRKGRWHRYDLLTGEYTVRLPEDELRWQDYRRFEDLFPYEKALVIQEGCTAKDYAGRYYRAVALNRVEEYNPELVRE